MYYIKVSFEVCKGSTICDPNPVNYLSRRTFRFPLEESTFDPDNEEEDMVTTEIIEDLYYPYKAGEMMRMKIFYEQGMLKHNSDWSGLRKLT